MIGEEDARMSAEQETAMYDQPEEVNPRDKRIAWHTHPWQGVARVSGCPACDAEDNIVDDLDQEASEEEIIEDDEPVEKIRPRTMSLTEAAEAARTLFAQAGVDVSTVTLSESKGGVDFRKVVAGPQQAYTKHQERVIKSLADARDTYAERSAVYKDNYKIVGRVMSALFPDGAPRLHDEMDYNRWHIFELMVVKITRYVNNFDLGHKDSLADLQVYTAILGAIDDELREQLEHYTSSEGN